MNQALVLALAVSLAATACRSTPVPGYSAADLPDRSAAAPEATEAGEFALEAEQISQADEGWTLTLKPYLFAAGLRGNAGFEGSSSEVNADFSDLLGSLDVGGMLGLEVAPPDSRLRFLVDLVYVALEEDGQSSDAGFDKVDAEIDQLVAEVTAALELQPEGLVDLLLGLRYWRLDGELSATSVPPGNDVSVDRSQSWVDPLIGVRSRLPLSADFDLLVRMDVGGYGLGSEYSYNLGGMLGWSVSDSLQLALGYRHVFASYDDDGFQYEIANAGPVLGLAWSL